MKINLEELKNRHTFIACRQHPSLPLLIWNYTNKCQFANAWDDYTMVARGLITDLEGNIIARPFKKFFNIDQREETKLVNLAALGKPNVYEKLDGSLGIQYYDGDIPQIATRGSFDSSQSKWASAWIESRFERADFIDGYTYIYEIIYPDNRIVIDYHGRSEIVLLAVIETETGKEIDYISEAHRLGLSYAQPINITIKQIQKRITKTGTNEEGFVLLYPNGLRVKVKNEEYIQLHKIITQTSAIGLWELYCRQKDDTRKWIRETTYQYPTQIRSWVEETLYDLEDTFLSIAEKAELIYRAIIRKKLSRKEAAAFIHEKGYSDVAAIVFKMFDNQPYDHIIHKMIRPKNTKPIIYSEKSWF